VYQRVQLGNALPMATGDPSRSTASPMFGIDRRAQVLSGLDEEFPDSSNSTGTWGTTTADKVVAFRIGALLSTTCGALTTVSSEMSARTCSLNM